MTNPTQDEKEKLVRKKPTKATAEVGFVNEQEVKNGEAEVVSHATLSKSHVSWHINDYEPIECLYDFNYKDEYGFIPTFDLDNMRERVDNGTSVSTICDDMKTFILENKDSNPELVQRAIAQLLGSVEQVYDNCVYKHDLNIIFGQEGYHRKNLGENSEEILEKIVATPKGEELHGLVCSTIADFGMHVLAECGIEATMLASGSANGNHTTLLWKRSDGKYVQSNYGKSYTIDASNMKDAAKTVIKNGLGLYSNGYIYFIDSKSSYQEFALKDEAVWGEELDKGFYNKQNVFNRSMSQDTAINGRVNVSSLGSVSAEVNSSLVFGSENKTKAYNFSLGYKKSGKTSLADSSTSVGAKLEIQKEKKKEDGVKFSDTKIVLDYTKLQNNQQELNLNNVQYLAGKTLTNAEEVENAVKEILEKEFEKIYPVFNSEEERQQAIEDYLNNACFYINTKPVSFEEYASVYPEQAQQFKNSLFPILTPEERAAKKNKFITSTANDLMQSQLNIHEPAEDPEKSPYLHDGFNRENISLMFQKTFGRIKTLFQDDTVRLSNGYEVSGITGMNYVLGTKSIGADARIKAQEGLQLDVAGENSLFTTNINGGLVADMALKTGTLAPTVSLGGTVSGGVAFKAKPTNELTISAGTEGYAVVTRPSFDYGVNLQTAATYKLNNNTTIFGAVNAGMQRQKLNIGGFNETTENNTTLGVSIGASLKNDSRVQLSYSAKMDKLNSTRNRDVVSLSYTKNI